MNEDAGNDRLDPPAAAAETTGAADSPTVEARATTVGEESPAPTEPIEAVSAPPGAPPSDPVAVTASPDRRGMFVPMWALVTVVGLLVFGLGLAGGYALADDEDHRDGGDRDATRNIEARGSRGGDDRFGPDARRNGGPRPGTGENDRRTVPSTPRGDSRVGSGFLGISVQNSADPEGAALVQVVASSPAADAGLQPGDVITSIDDTPVTSAAALTTLVRSHDSGDELSVTYERDGTEKTVAVTLRSRSQATQQ